MSYHLSIKAMTEMFINSVISRLNRLSYQSFILFPMPRHILATDNGCVCLATNKHLCHRLNAEMITHE